MATQHEVQKIDATHRLADILQENRRGRAVGVFSICSANRFVLEAAMQRAQRDGSLLLIESTSNQVNQFGGYTGQTPAEFVSFVQNIAANIGFPAEKIVLGGDHLGPQVWRREGAPSAMQKAAELVRTCVMAGYTKIHLDASMHLAGDPGDPTAALAEEMVSERAADLCKAAEEAYSELPQNSPAPLYVIGTDVPIPGGEQADTHAPEPTCPEDVARTIQLTKRAFAARGLESAWERVIAVVVQPGVEFGDDEVFNYARKKRAICLTCRRGMARHLRGAFNGLSGSGSFAADGPRPFRDPKSRSMVDVRIPGGCVCAGGNRGRVAWVSKRVAVSRVREALDDAMLANPEHWKNYYRGDDAALRFARKYSLSDRSRYYWTQPSVAEALHILLRT